MERGNLPEGPIRSHRLRPRSLRAKLSLFSLVLAVVPGGAFALIAFSSARAAIERAAARELATAAHDAARSVEAALADAKHRLDTWRRSEILRDLAVGDVDKRVARYLSSIAATDPAYVDLVAADRSGRVVAAAESSEIGTRVEEREWFRVAAGGGDWLQGPHTGSPSGRRTVEIAAPIPDPDEPGGRLGALLLVCDWGRIEAGLERIRNDLGGASSSLSLRVVDGRGLAVEPARPSGAGSPVVREHGAEDRGVVESGEGAVDREAAGGVLAVREPIGSLGSGWAVVASRRRDDALAPIARLGRQWAGALAAVVLASLAVAGATARRIVEPLRALTEATRQLARTGEAPGGLPVASRDEIGELTEAFNTMAADLERARNELVSAARLSFAGEIAAGIAHEVRTPLGVLRTSAQILARSVPENRRDQRELVDMIVAEVDRIERVVAELMELARPRDPLLEPTAIEPLLRRAAEFVGPQAAERGIAIEVAAAPGVALCDPEQVYRVVLNLVVNAMQVLGPGGHVRIRGLSPEAQRVGFEVCDDGPGMSPEVRERIFTPFFTTRAQGTGLGLALVERVVRAHGGAIEVETAPGRGACFRVWLPRASEHGDGSLSREGRP